MNEISKRTTNQAYLQPTPLDYGTTAMKPTHWIAITFTTMAALALAPSTHARETVSLNEGWRFHLGDVPGAQTPRFDDSKWQFQEVPHDWAFRAPYDIDASQEDMGGYKPGGIGWYRRTIAIPDSWSHKKIRIHFDGVYMNSRIWINGQEVSSRPYGYLSFSVDISKHLTVGENQIAIRVDNSLEPSARWYHPCGIYAPASLVVTAPLHIAPNGIFVQTPEISDTRATVLVSTELAAPATAEVSLNTKILDPGGMEVASVSRNLKNQSKATQTLTVPRPQRWDIDSPALYTAVTSIEQNGEVIDRVETRFGIRTIRWETDTGFWINDRNVKIKGVADHLEAGPVGGETHTQLIRWKIQLLKEMGANAIRVAHNPQVPEFYRACDELGMLVMDEIFDGWHKKATHDYGARFFEEHWESDLTDWVKRDRNHPCVILYSVGNETSGEIAPQLVSTIKSLDATRSVISGHSSPEHMDVLGVNGQSEKQSFFQKDRPAKPFVSTEAPHTWQVRGYYRSKTWWRDGYPNTGQDPFPLADLLPDEIFMYDWAPASKKSSRKQVFNSSYDNAMVRITARKNWELARDLPWYSGHFRWTGFDYLGEAGYVHGGWPFRAFMGGALDLAGFKKDLFYFYKSQWTEVPMVHLLPHWTHPKMEPGTLIPVWSYSNADEVELLLNGRSLGRDQPGRLAENMQCEWRVPWEPGMIEAVAYQNGNEVARARHTTAQHPELLQIETSKKSLAASPEDIAIVTIRQTDASLIIYPYGENRISFHLEGPARILSLENGNPVDTEPNFAQTTRRAFFGTARAFIQATGEKGDISLTVGAITGERRQLTSNQVSIDLRQITLRGSIKQSNSTVHFTTDGSEPTLRSRIYSKPFPVPLDTTVIANVYRDGQLLFTMEETFASDAGIHWQRPGEAEQILALGLQAEDANVYDGALTSDYISGHYGTGYAILHKNGKVQFYQENDGDSRTTAIRIRYQATKNSELAIAINDLAPQKLSLTAAPHKWLTATVNIPLARGANQVVLENSYNSTILIDEIEILNGI